MNRAAFMWLLLIAACGTFARPAPTPSDELAAYLESSKLTSLLATHLEAELHLAAGVERTRLAQRLARVYAERLESVTDAAGVADIERRAEGLLAQVPEADSLDLRLTLARSAYSRAEETAERWRLRLNSRADADAARRSFIDLEKSFSELAVTAERRVDSLEKQEEATTGSGSDRALLSAALANVRRTRSMGHFLAGWCAYYIAELDPAGAAEYTSKAERHFGWLLNGKPGAAPTPDRVPDHLLAYEHVARAVIGVALCESLKGSEESALRWLAIVERAKDITESVARQLPARKMLILSRASKWGDIAAIVDPRGGGSAAESLPSADARLLAVLSLEARQAGVATAEVRPLIILALESLAGRGELEQVLDLASRYFDRVDDIAESGFLPAYIRGLREFDRATREREASQSGDDQPVADPEVRRIYSGAAKFLQAALEADDAEEFASAIGGVSLLRALARFYASQSAAELDEAATLFDGAAERLDQRGGAEGARARLLAIRALDAAISRSPTGPAALTARRRAMADEFLSKHPTHTATATLLYERALNGRSGPLEAARDLLSISDDSPLAPIAHHQAARLLYERFLAAPREERLAAAEEFLGMAEPLLESSRRSLRPDDAEGTARTITTARRIVDCLLKMSDPDPRRVRRAHEFLANMVARGVAVSAALHAEIEYRSVQIALLEDDRSAAEAGAERLRDLDPTLASAALRAIYQRSADRFSAGPDSVENRLALAHAVLRLGQRVIDDLPRADADPAHPAVATLFATVAEAASFVFEAANDPRAGAAASELFARLIAAHPTDGRFLRGAAEHAQRSGDTASALAAWRGLLSGLPQGSDQWFEAKCRVIEMLVESDVPAARAALAQHRVLFPDLGPEPWRARLLKLEDALGAPASEGAP